MRSGIRSSVRTLLARAIASLSLALLAAAAHAQALPGGAQLGMSAQQLRDAVPALERVPRPVRMAGGLVGSWRGPSVEVGGVWLAPTFFLAEGELRRVEYLAPADAYESLLAWGRSTWGPELASQGSEGAYATWTSGTTQAYLQQTGGAQRPQVRLVVKLIATRDAGEL
jgi:hypothetical protein